MNAENTRKIQNDENYRRIIDLIDDNAADGENNISVNPAWVQGVRGRLREAGYTLREWNGRLGDYEGTWIEISWQVAGRRGANAKKLEAGARRPETREGEK